MIGQCHYCRGTLSLAVQQRNRCCPTCGSDIQSCRNCVHYDETLTSKCREPDSPWVADRNHQNNCPLFELSACRQTPIEKEATSEAERAKQAFKALFRTP